MRKPKPPVNPRPAILLGMMVILLVFGGFGTWAAMAPLASAVIAPGIVMVDSSRKKIQHPEGGVVKAFMVRDGDRVAAGDVLIRLDETRARASLAILQSRYDTSRATEARLLAEQENAESIHFPDELMQRSADAKVASILAGQRRLFLARREALAGESGILENRILQLQDDVTGIRAQQHSKERQSQLIQEEAASIKGLLEKGYSDRPRFLALQREAAKLDGERGEHISGIARANTEIGETRMKMIQLQREFQEQVITDLRSIDGEIADLEERIGAARHTLQNIDIRAPVAGVVVGMEVHTVGGVIGAGETVLEIVPADDRLVIEARVQPQHVDNIAVGQQADVQFTAFKRRTTPLLHGEVRYVSADRLVDGRTGESYYSARILVADEEVERLGDQQLQPGMPADIMIKTGERTALQYLSQPLLDSLEKAWREE